MHERDRKMYRYREPRFNHMTVANDRVGRTVKNIALSQIYSRCMRQHEGQQQVQTVYGLLFVTDLSASNSERTYVMCQG